MNEIPYDQIPAEPRAVLAEVYTRRGVEIWWSGRNQSFGGRRPCDMWWVRPREVLDHVNALADGNFG